MSSDTKDAAEIDQSYRAKESEILEGIPVLIRKIMWEHSVAQLPSHVSLVKSVYAEGFADGVRSAARAAAKPTEGA